MFGYQWMPRGQQASQAAKNEKYAADKSALEEVEGQLELAEVGRSYPQHETA